MGCEGLGRLVVGLKMEGKHTQLKSAVFEFFC